MHSINRFRMSKRDSEEAGSYRRFLAYFVPLALQGFVQSLTYPLVAMVASRGDGGAVNMAGLAQSHAVIGVLWTLGTGMITAGMVFGKTREGFARCVRINNGITLGVALIYLVLMLPPVSHLLFHSLLGLPPAVERPATLALMASLPVTGLFFLRNPYHIALFNSNATGLAFAASLGRVVLTLALAPIFCRLNAVGPVWATVCMTLGVAVELALSRQLALPYLRRAPTAAEPPPRHLEILVFALTLSLGALFLSLSGFMLGAFVARAPHPERMLPVFYLALGIVNPVAAGATRLQALIIAYYGRSAGVNAQLLKFSLAAGLALGLLPLAFVLPGLDVWYYVTLQKLDPGDLGLMRGTSWALAFFPLTVALRAYSEGKAAWFKKPMTVLTGQAVYLSVVAVTAFFALNLGVAGNLLGALAVVLANLAAAGIVLLSLFLERRASLPAPVLEVER